jgi:hypothetical protein
MIPLPGGIALPSATALPKFCGMKLRKKGFLGSGFVEFVSNDGRDPLDHFPHQWKVSVDT